MIFIRVFSKKEFSKLRLKCANTRALNSSLFIGSLKKSSAPAAEAKTTAGRIGIKVWLYKGEVLTGGPRSTPVEAPRRDRRDRRDGDRKNDRRERRDGDRAPRRDGGRFGERKQFSAGPRGPQGRPYQRPAAEAPKTEGGAN